MGDLAALARVRLVPSPLGTYHSAIALYGYLRGLSAEAIVALYREVLAPLGLTHPQYLVMLALWEESPQSVRSLGRKLSLEPATLSPLLRRLESAGLLERKRNPDDERLSVVREAPPTGGAEGDDDEYQWHTGLNRPTGVPDAVEFVDVHKAFGRNKILRGLNMGLPEGKISMILGPSGTGKSVCIKHMVGLLYPDEGDVLVHGESVPNMTDDELFDMRKRFGVLFQDGALFGSMNLVDNVAFPLRQHTDKSEDEILEIVHKRLEEVGLQGAHDKMPNELSGGRRKRAGFARALVLDPNIVLFDEPDSGLDPVRTALLCELIQEIHDENGGAYTVITHDIMSARRVAEYISVLWKGRIVEAGPAEELFNSENAFVRQFLSGESQGPLGME